MNLRLKQRLDLWLGGSLIFVLRPVVTLLGHALRRDHSLRVGREVCVVKLLGGGSLLLAYPALLGLRTRHPDARLSLVCSREVVPFAESLGIFDRLHVIDDSSPLRLAASVLDTWRRCLRVDTVIDLEVYSRLSTAFSVLTLARNRLGFFLHEVFWRRGLHTHLIFFNRFSGSHFFYEQAVALLGVEPASADACAARVRAALPEAPVPDLAGAVCIGPACSELNPERMLTADHWRQVFRERAADTSGPFVFLGAAGDRALADAIIAAVSPDLAGRRFENLCGRAALAESLAVLSDASAYWGIDSGLLHYARLFRVPSLSFWGPTDPATRLKPIEGLEEEVVYRKVPCSPCVHLAEQAPCRGNNLCIRNLFDGDGAATDEPEWPPYVV